VEGRGHRDEGPLEGKMGETSSSTDVSTRLQRIAELARGMPGVAFTTLAHHIDIDLLRQAYRETRKDGAVGIDGQTAEAYAEDLEGNLRSLRDRLHSGRYQAPPVRRVQIPKGDGKATRPIGIPTFEDKILQRAVAMVLGAVYEQDFLAVSLWMRRHCHRPIEEQHVALARKLRGHFAYYGITGNARCLGAFRYKVERQWRWWLHRRSQKGRMPWPRFQRVLKRYPLPPAVVVHSIYRRAANPRS
jgi:hypothetical protein